MNTEEIRPVFDHYWPVIKRAVDYFHGGPTKDQLWQMIAASEALFIPAPNSAIVVRSLACNEHKKCQIWLGAGKLDECLSFEPKVAEWAAETGHSEMEIVGREGWKRLLPQYRTKSIILSRAI